jgi:hypothetical protein
MLVPEEGFASKLIAIRQFHTLRGIRSAARAEPTRIWRDYIRWCFADPEWQLSSRTSSAARSANTLELISASGLSRDVQEYGLA